MRLSLQLAAPLAIGGGGGGSSRGGGGGGGGKNESSSIITVDTPSLYSGLNLINNIISMITIIILAFIFIRTMSFIAWNWKNDNKFGSIMVLFVCVASVALPLYMAFFRT